MDVGFRNVESLCAVFSLSQTENIMGSVAWSFSVQGFPFSLQALIIKVWNGQRLENWYFVELPQIIEESSNCVAGKLQNIG